MIHEPNRQYKQLRMKIGDRLHVAKLLGLSKRHIERRETGETKVTREQLFALQCLCDANARVAASLHNEAGKLECDGSWKLMHGHTEEGHATLSKARSLRIAASHIEQL